jgi:hypothetical protein
MRRARAERHELIDTGADRQHYASLREIAATSAAIT